MIDINLIQNEMAQDMANEIDNAILEDMLISVAWAVYSKLKKKLNKVNFVPVDTCTHTEYEVMGPILTALYPSCTILNYAVDSNVDELLKQCDLSNGIVAVSKYMNTLFVHKSQVDKAAMMIRLARNE
jgi:hypothetical protein